MFTADENIKKASTIRNSYKMMVLSEDSIAKEAHYHATYYRSYTSVNNNKDNDEVAFKKTQKMTSRRF